jgi:hypothetical protein
VSVAFESIAKELVLAHGVVGLVASGSAGHLGVLSVRRLRGVAVSSARVRTHAWAATVGTAVAFALGLLAYPHYRYAVRGLVLDRDAFWASNLFEVKENLAAFTLPLLLVVLALERDQASPRLAGVFGVVIAVFMVMVVVSGLLVTLVHGP